MCRLFSSSLTLREVMELLSVCEAGLAGESSAGCGSLYLDSVRCFAKLVKRGCHIGLVGGLFDEIEDQRQQKPMEWELESLLILEVDAAREAGWLLQDMPRLWAVVQGSRNPPARRAQSPRARRTPAELLVFSQRTHLRRARSGCCRKIRSDQIDTISAMIPFTALLYSQTGQLEDQRIHRKMFYIIGNFNEKRFENQ